MKESLAEVVNLNGGFFRRLDALKCGEDDRSLRAALRSKEIVRLRHGMYAPSALVPDDELEQHVLLARSVVAAQRGEVALTGPSAAALHGLALHGHDLSTVHLVRLDSGSSRTETGVVHHRFEHSPEVALYHGLLATTPVLTVWEVARMSDLEGGVATADCALNRDPTLLEPLCDLMDRFPHQPGARTARMSVRLARVGSQSVGESVLRVKFYRFAIPHPELQHAVYDQSGNLIGFADFGWPEFRHLGEFDGKVKYLQLLRPGESASDCVVREKRREDRMRAGRLGMTRFVWADLAPAQLRTTMVRLREDLERSRALYTTSRAVIA